MQENITNFPENLGLIGARFPRNLGLHWSAFCEKQCNELGIDLTIKSIHPINEGFGIEANARDERYRVINESLSPNELLLTAHHKDDQLETILFRIFRGTGIDGLKGISHYMDNLSLIHI